MDKKLNGKSMLCSTMFGMFKDNYLPYLDMEDFIIMWKALADHWGIYLDDEQWEEFAEEINSVASNRLKIFEPVFDKYFNN
jgi:hypothetical protein